MAGHSKWKNIQHRKGKVDAKRGKVFTKLIRALTVAAKESPDPDHNPRLRDAIDKAKLANMSNDTIDKAIKKGAGGLDADNMEEITYEGYGPGGVAIMVECMTDNRNRTVSEVRHAFSKCGGNLGTDGSVAYLFSKKGLISFDTGASEERIMGIAIEAGAEDVVVNADNSIDVFTTPDTFSDIKTLFQNDKLMFANAELSLIPSNSVSLNEEMAAKMIKLQDMLEDLDDVQNVYSNADISDDILEKMNT
jgi:YebC/PmpR family DNA-binding regulatory protein